MTGWNFACADWEQRLRESRSLVPDLPLFKDKADCAVRIFDKLCVPDIEGQPPFAIAAGEWFRDIVRVIFGSLDDEGVRHVPEVFALVGKKNSKTTSGAGLMVTALLVNEVPWAVFLFIGPRRRSPTSPFSRRPAWSKPTLTGIWPSGSTSSTTRRPSAIGATRP
ncbi:MAG: hypothetical protein WBW73_10230, partial [Rhodoplanes sp.]